MRNRESIYILWLCNKPEQKILSSHGAILILVSAETWRRPYSKSSRIFVRISMDLEEKCRESGLKIVLFSWFFMILVIFRDFSCFFAYWLHLDRSPMLFGAGSWHWNWESIRFAIFVFREDFPRIFFGRSKHFRSKKNGRKIDWFFISGVFHLRIPPI